MPHIIFSTFLLYVAVSQTSLGYAMGIKMEINNKILRAGIILIGFTLAICCFFVYYTKVDDPVFFKHYYEYAFQSIEEEELGSYNSQVQLSYQYIK